MTLSRHLQVSLEQTTYYHCTSRCVRRAYLCGRDRYTGKDFTHRRHWLERRIAELASIFAIDVLAYAIMENHYHVVVRIDARRAQRWSDQSVVARWARLFSVDRTADNTPFLADWRERLCSLSWFMRCINEPLARRANQEDGCTGRFWEGRFKSQALLDIAAVLKCMVYVDLNPIRAAIASTPEQSNFTSIRARIRQRDTHLAQLGSRPGGGATALPITRIDYLKLVDWSARCVRRGKRGHMSRRVPPILERLGLNGAQWEREIRHYGKWYYRAVGCWDALERYREHLGQRWLRGASKILKAASPIQHTA